MFDEIAEVKDGIDIAADAAGRDSSSLSEPLSLLLELKINADEATNLSSLISLD